jgi:nicotinamide-nucleotide amidase
VVGDNPQRISRVTDNALTRQDKPADILIFTGGLGPTEDDLTVVTLAQHFQQAMVSDPVSEERIKAFFIARNMTHSDNNLKQALRPADAKAIFNPVGTAPGLFWDVSEYAGRQAVILCFPGVPRELYVQWPEAMDALKQWLLDHGFTLPYLARTFLHFFGAGESTLVAKLGDIMEGANPTVAPYVGKSSVKLRLAAMAATLDEAETLLTPLKAQVLEKVGDYYIGEGNEIAMEGALAKLLITQQKTIAVAESCTGGLVSSRLTDVPGSSAYTALNLITYSNEAKISELGVDASVLNQHGAVSEDVAKAMAEGIRFKGGCDIGLSLTGIAGPDGGSDDKPVGLVYIGVAIDGYTSVKKVLVNPKLKREDIKFWFSEYALHTVFNLLNTGEQAHKCNGFDII